MIAVTGYRTTIVQELQGLVDDEVFRIDLDLSDFGCPIEAPIVDRYVLAAGVLHQKSILEQSAAEIQESLAVNLVNTIRLSEWILEHNPVARICIIGSESGFKGSYDTTYAAAKAGVHQYVTSKATGPEQQLVCVAPHIIFDSGMTERRNDYMAIREKAHQLMRAQDVARTVKRLLYDLHITNRVFRLKYENAP